MKNGAYWYDGVMGITQCGIPQDHEFTYKFIADESGTKWYHAHSSGLRADGLYGGFIVHEEPNEDDPHVEIGEIKSVIFTEFNNKDIHHSGSIGLVFSNFENNGTGENLENWDDRFVNPDGTHTAPYPHITTLVNGRANTVSDIPLDIIYSDDQDYISFISGRDLRTRFAQLSDRTVPGDTRAGLK